jgi:hypothetical protein
MSKGKKRSKRRDGKGGAAQAERSKAERSKAARSKAHHRNPTHPAVNPNAVSASDGSTPIASKRTGRANGAGPSSTGR